MSEDRYEPTKAEQLANLVSGSATSSYTGATVQRSHRFPLHIFIQIENMARMGNMPVSVCINELLGCGLEAVRKELSKEALEELTLVSKEQIERPTKSVTMDSRRGHKKASKAKP